MDCRDSDVAGGAVKGSMNIADGDWYNKSPALLQRIVSMAGIKSIPNDDDNTIVIQSDATVGVEKSNGALSFCDKINRTEVIFEDFDLGDDNRNNKSVEIVVVLHCMESIRRGPRCARRLFLQLQELGLVLEPGRKTELGLGLGLGLEVGLGRSSDLNVDVKVKLSARGWG